MLPSLVGKTPSALLPPREVGLKDPVPVVVESPTLNSRGAGAVEKKVIIARIAKQILAIKKANGGKVPKDYEGAYEKFMKNNCGQSTKVIAPVAVFDSSSEEFEETEVPLWPMLPMPGFVPAIKRKVCHIRSGSHSQCPPRVAVTPITNKFDAL